MKHTEVVKRNDLLVDLLSKHRGVANSISAKEIMQYMGEHGYHTSNNALRRLITQVKLERTLPICYKRGYGYFWASSRADIEVTIKDLEFMVASLKEHIEHLKRFIIE